MRVDPYEAVRRQVRNQGAGISPSAPAILSIKWKRIVGSAREGVGSHRALRHQLGAQIDAGLVVVKWSRGADQHHSYPWRPGIPFPMSPVLRANRQDHGIGKDAHEG